MNEDQKYCFNCKTLVDKKSNSCNLCGVDFKKDYSQKTKTCNYCKKEMPINAKYCAHCGQPTFGILNSKEIKELSSNPILSHSLKLEKEDYLDNLGGTIFHKFIRVFPSVYNEKIIFKTLLEGKIEFSIDDFVLCSKEAIEIIKKRYQLPIFINQNNYENSVVLFIFKNKYFITNDNLVSEKLIDYIYRKLSNQLLEQKNTIYNTEHEHFEQYYTEKEQLL